MSKLLTSLCFFHCHSFERHFTHRLTISLYSRGNVFTQALVDIEHVQVDPPQLDDEWMADSFAGSDVCLQDAAQLTHRLRILQDVHVLWRTV